MIQEVLADLGHHVTTAEEGAAGSALLAQFPFDLLITDIVMPKQDGLETIMATHRAYPDLPILAISGGGRHAWTDVLETANLFGASQTLLKPFSIRKLIECVETLLPAAAKDSREGGTAA